MNTQPFGPQAQGSNPEIEKLRRLLAMREGTLFKSSRRVLNSSSPLNSTAMHTTRPTAQQLCDWSASYAAGIAGEPRPEPNQTATEPIGSTEEQNG